jgi:hypothetical protein
VDFHALRGSYISHLVSSGASVKACQVLARHSTPSLTIGIYAKASLHDIKGAVEALPDLTARPALKPEATAATGTDGRPISKRFALHLPYSGDMKGRDEPDSCAITQSDKPTMMMGLTAENTGSDGTMQVDSEYRRWESNPHGRSRPEDLKSSGPDDVKASPVDGSLSINDRFALPLPYGTPELPPDLATVVAAWPELPEALRAGIVAMVKAATPNGQPAFGSGLKPNSA